MPSARVCPQREEAVMVHCSIIRRHRRLLLATLAVVSCVGLGLPSAGTAWAAPSSPATQSVKREAASFSISFDATTVVRADRTAETVMTTRIKVLGEAALQSVGQQVRGYVD